MSKRQKESRSPRIENRRARHDYFISAKLECGMSLLGSEVKSLRNVRAQLQDSFAKVEGTRLVLYNCHIDPYQQAGIRNHDPRRQRFLLAHKREIRKLASESSVRGVSLIPLAIYFKNGRAKLELGVARGKKQFDKRQCIRRREQEREVRRAMTHRR